VPILEKKDTLSNDKQSLDFSFKRSEGVEIYPNRNLDNPNPLTLECTICFDKKSDAIILECGHGGICFDCGKQILKRKHICPFCRNPAVAIYKIQKSDNPCLIRASDVVIYIDPKANKEKIIAKIMNRNMPST